MSDEAPIEESFEPTDPIESNQEFIKENREQIIQIIENISNSIRSVDRVSVADDISAVASRSEMKIKNNNKAEFMISILRSIYMMNDELCKNLAKKEVDDEVIDFLVELSLKYREAATRALFRQTQGDNWWSDVSSEIIVDGENIRIDYTITIDMQSEVEISTNISSSVLLASQFIQGTLRPLEQSENGTELTEDEIRELAQAYDNFFQVLGVEIGTEEKLMNEDILSPHNTE